MNIPIFSYAADPDGSVTTVEFFAGNISLGFGGLTAVPPPLPPGQVQPPILIVVPTNYWELVWTNPPLGTNISLATKATDNGGASTVSARCWSPSCRRCPPPTNRPPSSASLPLTRSPLKAPIARPGPACPVQPGVDNWLRPVLPTGCSPIAVPKMPPSPCFVSARLTTTSMWPMTWRHRHQRH